MSRQRVSTVGEPVESIAAAFDIAFTEEDRKKFAADMSAVDEAEHKGRCITDTSIIRSSIEVVEV